MRCDHRILCISFPLLLTLYVKILLNPQSLRHELIKVVAYSDFARC